MGGGRGYGHQDKKIWHMCFGMNMGGRCWDDIYIYLYTYEQVPGGMVYFVRVFV